MTVSEPKDPRSTQRKRARKVLEATGRPYFCGSTSSDMWDEVSADGCGRSNRDEEAPGGFFPAMGELQVNHINKNIMDNDPANLQYLCPSCHKEKDQQTEKGVSLVTDEFGYNFGL